MITECHLHEGRHFKLVFAAVCPVPTTMLVNIHLVNKCKDYKKMRADLIFLILLMHLRVLLLKFSISS